MRATKTIFLRRKKYEWCLFSWWLKTVPLEAFQDIEWATFKREGASDEYIRSITRKRSNFGHRAYKLNRRFEECSNINDHLSVWYDGALGKSVHNCIYLFEPYKRYCLTDENSVCSSGHVDAVRNSLPPAIFERFVRVRVLDGFLRFFFIGRDVDPLTIDNIPSYHRWNDYDRCYLPRD